MSGSTVSAASLNEIAGMQRLPMEAERMVVFFKHTVTGATSTSFDLSDSCLGRHEM